MILKSLRRISNFKITSLIEYEVKDMDILKVEGSNHREVGIKIGKQTKEKIHYFLSVPYNRSKIEKILDSRDLLSTVQKECEIFAPELLEELEGIAIGSGISFEKLFAFNILDSMGNLPFSAIDCSSIVEKIDSKVYFGHNEDWSSGTNGLFMLDMRINDVSIFAFTYYGLLSGISFSKNSYEIFFTMNGLVCNDLRIGVPRSFVNRKVIQSKSIEEAIEIIKSTKRSRGQNYNIFTKDEIVNIESSATDLFVRRNLDVLYHTNHYTMKDMLKYENHRSEFSMKQSRFRLLTIEKLSKRLKNLPPEERYIKILSSHENYPFTLCIHDLELSDGKRVKTFATVVGSTDGRILATFDNPCYGKFQEINTRFERRNETHEFH